MVNKDFDQRINTSFFSVVDVYNLIVAHQFVAFIHLSLDLLMWLYVISLWALHAYLISLL